MYKYRLKATEHTAFQYNAETFPNDTPAFVVAMLREGNMKQHDTVLRITDPYGNVEIVQDGEWAVFEDDQVAAMPDAMFKLRFEKAE